MLKRRKLRKYIIYDNLTGLIDTKCEITLQAKGYMRILIENKTYRLSDVIWTLIHGALPEHARVLQLNKNKLDFRLSNLYLDMSIAERIKKQEAMQNSDTFANSRRVDQNMFK